MAYPTDQLFTCDLCNLSFTSKQHIRIHLDGILHQKMVHGRFQQQNSAGNIFKRITSEAASSPAQVIIPGLGDYDEVEAPSPETPRSVVGLKSCLKRRPSSSSISSSTSDAFTISNHNLGANSVVMSDPAVQSANVLRAIRSILLSSRNSNQTNSNRYSEVQISCMINSLNDDGFQRLSETNETERVSSVVGEMKRKLDSRSVSLAVNLLDIQRELQKPFSVSHEPGSLPEHLQKSEAKSRNSVQSLLSAQFDLLKSYMETDSQPKHLPKSEVKSRSSVQSLLSAQFDLLKSYMVEQLGSSANHGTATNACKQTPFDARKQLKHHHLMEDDSETSRNVMDLHYSECALSESLDSECKIPFLCDSDEIVCDSAPATARLGAANRNTKRLISQTFRENDVPLAVSQATRNTSDDFSCKTFSHRHQNVDPVGPPPMQRPLRPRAPSVRGQTLTTSCLSSGDHLPDDSLDIREYACQNLTPGISRHALLPAADEPWPVAGQSAAANSAADGRVVSGALDDYVARIKLNLSRGLPYSLSASRLNEKEKFTPATSSQQKEKLAPAISSQQNIPAKKVLLMTPPEPAAPLETRKTLLPTPPVGLDFHPPAENGAVSRSRPVAPNSASSSCGWRTEQSIRVTLPLLPNPTVEGRPRQALEETGLLCPQLPKHRLLSPSSFLRCSDVSSTPYAKPTAVSLAVGKKSATVSDSSVKDAMTSHATLPSSSSSSSSSSLSLKTTAAIEVPVVVSSTGAATTLKSYSSGVNKDLPEVEETKKSSREQAPPEVKQQKQVRAAQKLTNYYSKEVPAESAIISDEKLEFNGKRSDRSPGQVAEDTVDKKQPSGGVVRVEKINDFHKQSEGNHLLDLGPLTQQCHGSVAVGKNTNAQDLMSEEQLDPHLKLQREIEGIMQERIKELKETLPESMICSINEGKIPLEFLDRISDLIPREVIDKAVNEVERSKAVNEVERSKAVNEVERSKAVNEVERSKAVNEVERSKAVNEVERSAGVTLAKIDKSADSQMQETGGCQFSNLEMIETSAGNTVDQQVPEQVPVQMPEQVSAHLSKPDRENIKAQVEVETLKTLELEIVKKFIEGILGDFVNEDGPPVNIGVVEKLDVTDRTVALKMLQDTGIRDVLVIVEILNFFKTFDNELLSALMNTYDANADGKESVLYRVAEVVLKKRHEMQSQESEPKSNATVGCSNKSALPIPDNRQENASDVLDRPIVTETVSNTLSQQILDSKTSCVEKMPIGTGVLCVNSEPVNQEHCAKEITKTNNTSISVASDVAIATIAVSKFDKVAISSSIEHSDITSSCGGTELQLTTLGRCDRSDDTKVLEPMELAGSRLSRSAELSNTQPKITDDSKMLEAESTQKQMLLGAAEEIADAAVSGADLKLNFEKHLCGSSEAADASNSKEHSSSDDSGDSKQEVQPLSSTSAVDSLTPNDEVSCAKDNSACVAVSLANSLLPQQKLSEVERSKPKKILLPTPKLLPSLSRPDLQPLMALHDPPRLQAPACFLGRDEASVKPHIPPHLLFSQRSPSRPLSSMPCPRSFSSTKVLLPSPNSISVPRFQFPNEEPGSIVQLEVSRPLLAHRTPLLRLPPHETTSRSSHQVPVLRRALLPTPNMSLTETLTVGSRAFVGSFHPLKRQIPQLMMEGLGPPPFKRLR